MRAEVEKTNQIASKPSVSAIFAAWRRCAEHGILISSRHIPEESLRKLPLALVFIASAALSGCATHYVVDPVAAPDQEVRYDRGTPTTYSERTNGAVQITPFGVDERDGRLVFGVAA